MSYAPDRSPQASSVAGSLAWRRLPPPGDQSGTPLPLGQPVVDRESFRNRIDGLADIVSNFDVADVTMAEADRERTGSLNRLEAALRNRSVDADRAAALVAPLRAVNGMRRSLTHSGAASQGPRHAAVLGLAWPPADWSAAWYRVQARTIEALRELRRELDAGGD